MVGIEGKHHAAIDRRPAYCQCSIKGQNFQLEDDETTSYLKVSQRNSQLRRIRSLAWEQLHSHSRGLPTCCVGVILTRQRQQAPTGKKDCLRVSLFYVASGQALKILFRMTISARQMGHLSNCSAHVQHMARWAQLRTTQLISASQQTLQRFSSASSFSPLL